MKFLTPAYPPPSEPFTHRPLTQVTDFIVHHSDGPKSQTPLQIDAFERNRSDGPDIYTPYTWLIDDNGNVYTGRPVDAVSAASFGRNTESVAVCVIGAFQKGTPEYNGPPSAAALASLYDLCLWAHRTYPSISQTFCHGDIARMFYNNDSDYATACCGSELRALVPAIKSRVAAALRKQ